MNELEKKLVLSSIIFISLITRIGNPLLYTQRLDLTRANSWCTEPSLILAPKPRAGNSLSLTKISFNAYESFIAKVNKSFLKQFIYLIIKHDHADHFKQSLNILFIIPHHPTL